MAASKALVGEGMRKCLVALAMIVSATVAVVAGSISADLYWIIVAGVGGGFGILNTVEKKINGGK